MGCVSLVFTALMALFSIIFVLITDLLFSSVVLACALRLFAHTPAATQHMLDSLFVEGPAVANEVFPWVLPCLSMAQDLLLTYAALAIALDPFSHTVPAAALSCLAFGIPPAAQDFLVTVPAAARHTFAALTSGEALSAARELLAAGLHIASDLLVPVAAQDLLLAAPAVVTDIRALLTPGQVASFARNLLPASSSLAWDVFLPMIPAPSTVRAVLSVVIYAHGLVTVGMQCGLVVAKAVIMRLYSAWITSLCILDLMTFVSISLAVLLLGRALHGQPASDDDEVFGHPFLHSPLSPPSSPPSSAPSKSSTPSTPTSAPTSSPSPYSAAPAVPELSSRQARRSMQKAMADIIAEDEPPSKRPVEKLRKCYYMGLLKTLKKSNPAPADPKGSVAEPAGETALRPAKTTSSKAPTASTSKGESKAAELTRQQLVKTEAVAEDPGKDLRVDEQDVKITAPAEELVSEAGKVPPQEQETVRLPVAMPGAVPLPALSVQPPAFRSAASSSAPPVPRAASPPAQPATPPTTLSVGPPVNQPPVPLADSSAALAVETLVMLSNAPPETPPVESAVMTPLAQPADPAAISQVETTAQLAEVPTPPPMAPTATLFENPAPPPESLVDSSSSQFSVELTPPGQQQQDQVVAGPSDAAEFVDAADTEMEESSEPVKPAVEPAVDRPIEMEEAPLVNAGVERPTVVKMAVDTPVNMVDAPADDMKLAVDTEMEEAPAQNGGEAAKPAAGTDMEMVEAPAHNGGKAAKPAVDTDMDMVEAPAGCTTNTSNAMNVRASTPAAAPIVVSRGHAVNMEGRHIFRQPKSSSSPAVTVQPSNHSGRFFAPAASASTAPNPLLWTTSQGSSTAPSALPALPALPQQAASAPSPVRPSPIPGLGTLKNDRDEELEGMTSNPQATDKRPKQSNEGEYKDEVCLFDEDGLAEATKQAEARDSSVNFPETIKKADGDPDKICDALSLYAKRLDHQVNAGHLISSRDALLEMRTVNFQITKCGLDGKPVKQQDGPLKSKGGDKTAMSLLEIPADWLVATARAVSLMGKLLIKHQREKSLAGRAPVQTSATPDKAHHDLITSAFYSAVPVARRYVVGETSVSCWRDQMINPFIVEGNSVNTIVKQWFNKSLPDDEVVLGGLRAIHEVRDLLTLGTLSEIRSNLAPRLLERVLDAGMLRSADELRAQYHLGPGPWPSTSRSMMDLWALNNKGDLMIPTSWKPVTMPSHPKPVPSGKGGRK